MREGEREYKRAKGVIDDIIFSFNGDIKRQNEKIEEISRRFEEVLSGEIRRLEELNAMLVNIRGEVDKLMKYKEVYYANYEELKTKVDDLSVKYDEVLKKLSEIEKSRIEKAEVREKNVESKVKPSRTTFTAKDDKVLVSLTETELKVLEILAKEGEKTVPEIKDRIGLTREHTARLMKSLYTRGYVERRDDRIPYVYRLNKEMEEILRGESPKT
ncbi:MAG: helix-turn-helix domain-containing protein [Candidatus Bathyarchaeia archaeon]|nr:MarR family transcriptional regulator [Candidatus Bathyarchaeota archaeon]